MGFEVTDLEAVIEDLRRRGVTFEAVEVPGFEIQGEMAVWRASLSFFGSSPLAVSADFET